MHGHEFQRVPLTTWWKRCAKWNAYVDKGSDPEFARGSDAPMYRIEKPPFYAASLYPVWHDSYGGLRINGRAQVIDMQGEADTRALCGWRSRAAAANKHGLGRALVHGYIAGTNAVSGAEHLTWKRRRRLPRSRLTATSVVVWDVPSAIVAGERFRHQGRDQVLERVPPGEHGLWRL